MYKLLLIIISLLKNIWLTGYQLWYFRKKNPSINIQETNYFLKKTGIVTLPYPHKNIKISNNARYKLHNEIDDCIVCDKCVKICPVNCIDIDAIRSPTLIGKTSDGKAKRIYPAKFDIDMGKCCFCGLCTIVCPTKCLTMTDAYDYSTEDIQNHTFSFANMTTEEIAQKKQEWKIYKRKSDHIQ